MSDTPRTDAIFTMLRRAQKQVSSREDWIALQEGAKNGVEYLERELAAMTAERDALRENRDQWMADCMQAWEHRDGANAQLALCEAERDRMRPVVEAAQRWRHSNFAGDESELTSAVDTYEAATCPSATETR